MLPDRRPHAGPSPGALLAVVSLLLAACQDSVPELADHPAQASSAAGAAHRTAHKSNRQRPLKGEWVESLHYRVRMVDVVPCDAPGPNDDPREGFRLGVTIEVEASEDARTSPVVVSPAAAKIEKHGKAFPASRHPTPSPNCENLLELERLSPGDATEGVFVFEAPNESYFRAGLFSFQPPRWGGEAKTQLRLPRCFGDCVAATQTE